MSASIDLLVLKHVVYNVFLPPKLPQEEKGETLQRSVDLEIIHSVIRAAREYSTNSGAKDKWHKIDQMLQNLYRYTEDPPTQARISDDMKGMGPQVLYIRAQNVGIIIRKQVEYTTFEVFEAQAVAEEIMSTTGKIVRYFPGPAVQIPNSVSENHDFINEVANILSRMNKEALREAQITRPKNDKDVSGTIHPNYFVQYFLGFLRGIGATFDPPQITKRLADEILWLDARKPWRRSPIWLIVRVALQTSLESTIEYKHFMLYYHATIISECNKRDDISSDLLYAMRMKAARRLYKVGDTAPQFLISVVKDTAKATQDLLQKRWKTIQAAQAQALKQDQSFASCEFDSDTNQTLPNSRGYLERVFKGRNTTAKVNSFSFTTMHSPRLEDVIEFAQYANGGLSQAFRNDPDLALFDFEASVFENLSFWTTKRRDYPGSCSTIFSCFQQYQDIASSYYSADVAEQSIMMLTLVRLWMAIDELATREFPLLSEFSPELPENILDSLLLRTSQFLEQARLIQQYIRERHNRALSENMSIFSSNVTESSFGVRFFRSSSLHQKLKMDIEENAQQQRKNKIQELIELNSRSKQLDKESRSMQHQYYEPPNPIGQPPKKDQEIKQKKHSEHCVRCMKEKERDGLRIQLYEWPLPPEQVYAEAVVFELHLPESFRVWRDTTYQILIDMGTLNHRQKCNQQDLLERYNALASWFSTNTVKPRITVASRIPFKELRCNKIISIPTMEHQVCVENPLRFKLYDRNRSTWACEPFTETKFARYGTMKIPEGSVYSHLKYSLEETTHTSNEVLADQYNCPKELSLHEHIAFGTLRSGASLQWMNIVRGLEENNFTLSSEEVWLLHTQAVWQIGPMSGDGSRSWHEELCFPEFGTLLISQCTRVLDRVEANWLHAYTLLTIVTLVHRLLVSSPLEEMVQLACKFLRKARVVAYQWMRKLQSKLREAVDNETINYQHRVCEMAAICRTTYDTEPSYMGRLLSTHGDYTALIESSTALFDTKPPDFDNAPTALKTILCRDRRFAHKIAPFITASACQEADTISIPLCEIWGGYERGTVGWSKLEHPNCRWLTTLTAGHGNDRAQDVHFNTLTGQLLIDNKPLGRLPTRYIEHPTYIRLFGQKILNVVPAKSPGMEFTTKTPIHNYQVSLGFLKEGGNEILVIQASSPSGRRYELIPHKTLREDFPLSFSEEYHHWADYDSKTIEFRPISAAWTHEKSHWILSFGISGKTAFENTKDNSLLIDIHSKSFEHLAQLISPLESDRYLHAKRSPKGLIDIELPRMNLSFFINENKQLESYDFQGRVRDEDQSAGTLFGLRNQFLLREKGTLTQSLPQSRSILIPQGDIDFQFGGDHVSVTIISNTKQNVRVFHYLIDKDLGHLEANAGLTSRLFKIYLHALTSYCLPDPLTGHTGTEEALYELSHASTLSFEQISLEQAELLKAIGLLTPRYKYYPNDLECMQTTEWSELASLSQHFAFSTMVAEIFHYADTLQIFHPLQFKIQEFINSIKISDKLLQRTAGRNAVYYASDLTAHISPFVNMKDIRDKAAPGRDEWAGDWELAGQAASWASDLAHRSWGRPMFKPYDLVSLLESWGTLDHREKYDNLSYQSAWFSIDLKLSWINCYNLLRHAAASDNRYILSACLASLAFSQAFSLELIPVLLSFATNPEFCGLEPPSQKLFNFKDGYEPTQKRIAEIISEAAVSIESSPAAAITQNENEPNHEFRARKNDHYNTHQFECQSQLVDLMMGRWLQDSPEPEIPIQLNSQSTEIKKWVNLEPCIEAVSEYFSRCVLNRKMRDHLRQLEKVLSSCPASEGTNFTFNNRESAPVPLSAHVYGDPWNMFTTPILMCHRPAPDLAEDLLLSNYTIPKRSGPSADTSNLENMLLELQQSENSLNKRYASDMEKSRKELGTRRPLILPQQLPKNSISVLVKTRDEYLAFLEDSLRKFNSALSPQNEVEDTIFRAGVWTRATPRTILQLLSLRNRSHLDRLAKWRIELISYAQGYGEYQRFQRLIALAENHGVEEFYKEVDLPSGDEFAGLDDPDWLLVQINGNFVPRPLQRKIAQEMISPSSDSNTVLQLNMGEGKSSVIVPLIAASLANSSQLVRVVVLKPLWRQMFDLLVNRLSGLCGRRIYYLPFSRDIHLDARNAEKLRSLYEECMLQGGILLSQPEHILSFRLMGIDRLISSCSSKDTEVANTLRTTESWLHNHTRDVLDESDEILHVKYQLVYTVGEQQPLEDHPDRWTTIQQLLHLTATHVKALQGQHPDNLSYKFKGTGKFPIIRIMLGCTAEVEGQLISSLAKDILDGRLPNLSCDHIYPSVRESLHEFLTKDQIPYSQYESLQKGLAPEVWKIVLLIRGILAHGILILALKNKHYLVDYGLDPSRSLLAVPYSAKDTPSPRAEFGHPDVAIILTCLSYYYRGLTKENLDLCFKLLFRLDNPSLEYEQWVKQNSSIPTDLKQLNGVNTNDREQLTKRLFDLFSHNSATIDFFVSTVVFPTEAKEFPKKLATSGWDLAETKPRVITGFSGTNDNRYLLPTSISQADPVRQLSTNALVLTYLLQPENNFYLCMRNKEGGSLTNKGLMELLVAQTPEIRILLDVGAQIIDMKNKELVEYWLSLRPEIEAAIYFNDQHELMVLPKNGGPTPLKGSPFIQSLDKCIIYLDDAHTRGTDLKLPRETRALVTLGPKVTKDRLIQGCMRMRKLGHGQSVVFAAPPEIDTQIRKASSVPINAGDSIGALDILRWAMLQTCVDLEHHVSHWAQQGVEFHQRSKAQEQCGLSCDALALRNGWVTSGSRTLEEMYGVLPVHESDHGASFTQRAFDIPDLRKNLEHLGITKLEDPGVDEEQERELDHEVEREREIQRPPKREPAEHLIHSEVEHFINTGVLLEERPGIMPLFHYLRAHYPQICDSWSPLLFASVDFLNTISDLPINQLSEYMRPVNWILSGPGRIHIVLSPYEVQELLPLIRRSSVVQLHVYSPRVTSSMISFSDLKFYSLPHLRKNHISDTSMLFSTVVRKGGPMVPYVAAPSDTAITRYLTLASEHRSPESISSIAQLQLDLFAGQLYLSSYEDYMSLCASLGITTSPRGENEREIEVGSDSFVNPQHRDLLSNHHWGYSACEFTASPILALKDIIERRRKGMKYLLTHTGQILHGRNLTPNDFE
ncbi:hypothetical protein RHS02_07821, partial [Rhizoctonia solani]